MGDATIDDDKLSEADRGRLPAVLADVHPLGYVAAGLLVVAVVATVVGTEYLIGNLPWWLWLTLVAVAAISTRPAILHGIRRAIEAVTDFTGAFTWRLAWFVFAVQLFNVVTRYTNDWFEQDILFGQTTSLAWMSFGMLFLLGVNYGVKAGVNPRVDFWWAEFPARRKAAIDFVIHTFLFLPFVIMGGRLLVGFAKSSLGQRGNGDWPDGWRVWRSWEQASDADQLAVGPIQAFILVGFVLWGSQIVAEMIKTGFVLIGRDDLAERAEQDAPLRVE